MIREKTSRLIFALFVVAIACLGVRAQGTQSREFIESREINSKVIKLYGEGKFDEAIPLAKRALELREKAVGAEHEELIPLLTNLSELHRAKEQWKQARAYVERLLAVTRKKFGENNLRTAQLLNTLGYIAFEQRQGSDAEKFFVRSLEIKEKILAADDLSLAGTIYNLAEVYRLRRNYLQGEPLYQRAVRIYEKVPGKNSADLIRALEAYSMALLEMKKTERADEVRRRLSQVLAAHGIVEGGVLNGRALKLTQPPYPQAARRDYASGIVRVRITIDETGKVINANAIDPGAFHPALVRASEAAALQSLFTPTYLSGKAVKVNGIIVYRFVAQ